MATKKRETVGIIGLGKFGMNVAKELASSGVNILCIDKNDYKVREILEYCEYAYVTRDLSKSNLEELGFATCSTVIICIGEEIDISVLTTLNLISLGVKKVIAKAISEDQGKILEKLGAQVIFPERDSALLLSKALLSKNIIDFISLGNDIEVSEIAIGKNQVGKSIIDLSIRNKYDLNVIALETNGRITTKILPNYKFQENDKIVVIGEKKDILKFEKTIQ
jgi:trk system potassium uptake protein TrkA